MLIRLFRGVIRDGAQDRMMRALHEHALPHLASHPAVLSSTLAPLRIRNVDGRGYGLEPAAPGQRIGDTSGTPFTADPA